MGNKESMRLSTSHITGDSTWNGFIQWIDLDSVFTIWQSDEKDEFAEVEKLNPIKPLFRIELYYRKKLPEVPCPGHQHAYVIFTCAESIYYLVEKTTDGVEITYSKLISQIKNKTGHQRKLRSAGRLVKDSDIREGLMIQDVSTVLSTLRLKPYDSKYHNSLEFAKEIFNYCSSEKFYGDLK